MIPIASDAAAQFDADALDSPLCSSSMSGSQAARPWVMKNAPMPSSIASRTPGAARSAFDAAHAGSCTAVTPPAPGALGARRLTIHHVAAAARLSAASKASTSRQPPNTGTSTEFVSASANRPPIAGAEV
jgi:hypothetical protein